MSVLRKVIKREDCFMRVREVWCRGGVGGGWGGGGGVGWGCGGGGGGGGFSPPSVKRGAKPLQASRNHS